MASLDPGQSQPDTGAEPTSDDIISSVIITNFVTTVVDLVSTPPPPPPTGPSSLIPQQTIGESSEIIASVPGQPSDTSPEAPFVTSSAVFSEAPSITSSEIFPEVSSVTSSDIFPETPSVASSDTLPQSQISSDAPSLVSISSEPSLIPSSTNADFVDTTSTSDFIFTSSSIPPEESSTPLQILSSVGPSESDIPTTITSVNAGGITVTVVETSTSTVLPPVITSTSSSSISSSELSQTQASRTASSSASATTAAAGGGGLHGGAKIAVAVAVPVGSVALISILFLIFWTRRKKAKLREDASAAVLDDYNFQPNDGPSGLSPYQEKAIDPLEDGLAAGGIARAGTLSSKGESHQEENYRGWAPTRSSVGAANYDYSNGDPGPISSTAPYPLDGPMPDPSTYSLPNGNSPSMTSSGSGFQQAYHQQRSPSLTTEATAVPTSPASSMGPPIRDVSARRNTRIETQQRPHVPNRGNNAISTNF